MARTKLPELPEDADLPLDARGKPNRSYLGHTSELIPTPWDREGAHINQGDPRRFPPRSVRTYAQEQERKRLAAIENPGLCQSRLRWEDSWCHARPMAGMNVCWWHGGRFVHSRKAAARRIIENEILKKAARIVESNS